MKRRLIILLLLLSTCSVFYAQESSVFLKAGLNLANVSITEDGAINEANMLPTLQVGLQGDLPVTSFLSIQPGLLFMGKGSKTQAGNPSDANYYRATSNPFYIELPVNVVFKAPLDNAKFFVGAGPYVAMGIAGKRKAEGKIFGVGFSSNDNIKFSNDDPTTSGEEGAGFGILKRFDYGLNGTAGFEGKAAMFSVNYGLGLAKLQSGSNSSANDKNKHRILSFTVGFRL